MEILTKKLSEFSFDDVVSFAEEKNSEGMQLDYKEELPDKMKLAKLVCAFANTRGGVIVVGIRENRKTGEPTKWEGIDDGRHDEYIAQVIGNISPIPSFGVHKTNDNNGKVFLLLRIYEGNETPYYAHNDSNIWIRTGSTKKSVNIASPEHIELLFGKREKAQISRNNNKNRAELNYKSFLKSADRERKNEIEVEKQNYEAKKIHLEDGDTLPPFKSQIFQHNLGINVAMLDITLQPFFPQTELIRPLDIETLIQESEFRTRFASFPSRATHWDSISEGMIHLSWKRRDGGIDSQQVFANGLMSTSTNVLKTGEGGAPTIYLSWFAAQLYVTLSGAGKMYEKLGFSGSILGTMEINGMENVYIDPAIRTMWPEPRTSVFAQRSWDIAIDTMTLSNESDLKEYVAEKTRDIHWSFGFKDLQKGISVERLNERGVF